MARFQVISGAFGISRLCTHVPLYLLGHFLRGIIPKTASSGRGWEWRFLSSDCGTVVFETVSFITYREFNNVSRETSCPQNSARMKSETERPRDPSQHHPNLLGVLARPVFSLGPNVPTGDIGRKGWAGDGGQKASCSSVARPGMLG